MTDASAITPRELMERVYRLETPPRIPFAPAIYEHKAALVDTTPTKLSHDPTLLYEALIEEYDRYRPDMLVVGVDVYNIEAESLGAEVTFFQGDDPSIPGIRAEGVILEDGESVEKLKVSDPQTDGRMPVNLEAARRIQEKLGDEIMIRGAVSGPYSLACEIIGAENFIVQTLTDPDYAASLMAFSQEVIFRYGKAYLDLGVEPIVFDSRAMPPMTSPDIFARLVTPATKTLNERLFAAGAKVLPYIIGGETTTVVDSYIATGSKNILCDFPSDWPVFKAACAEAKISVRRNIDPAIMQGGKPPLARADARNSDPRESAPKKPSSTAEIRAIMTGIVEEGHDLPGFLAGTGVLPYDTPSENVIAAREAVEEASRRLLE